MCKLLGNNTVVLQRYLNPHHHNEPKPAGSEDGGTLSVGQQQYKDGVVTSQFNLSNFKNSPFASLQDIPVLSQSEKYHPVFAVGQLDDNSKSFFSRKFYEDMYNWVKFVIDDPKEHAEDSRIALKNLVGLDQNEIILYKVSTLNTDDSARFIRTDGY